MPTYIYDFPLPTSNCSPNKTRNVHSLRLADARKHYRTECFYVARRAQSEGKLPCATTDRARIALWFQTLPKKRDGRYRPEDFDNGVAACKGLIDALSDAQVIRGDTLDDLTCSGVERLPYAPGDKPLVRVILEIGE